MSDLWSRFRDWAGARPQSDSPQTSRPAAGSVYDGLTMYTTDPHFGRPGYYALGDDGRTPLDPPLLLTWVDDAPGNEEDGSGHFIVADHPDDAPYFSHMPESLKSSNVVSLEAHVQGKGGVNVGE